MIALPHVRFDGVSKSFGATLALALASRGNLPGADALAAAHFDKLFAGGDFKGAAEAAAVVSCA